MSTQRSLRTLLTSAVLALVVSLPALAQLPEGFRARNIGDGTGSTAVADGKWTVKGVGADIWGTDQDHFHFVAKEQSGDGTISARILSATPGHDDGWQKIGPMIRENDTVGSPHMMVEITNRGGSGVMLHWRAELDGESADRYGYAPRSFPIWMRVQRAGNDLSGYFSYDGKLWSFMRKETIAISGDKAQYGLAVSSHDTEIEDTAEFDNVAVEPGARTVSTLSACGSANGVLLTWQPVKGAQSYNVYRGPSNTSLQNVKLEQLAKVNTDTVSQASFSDLSESLVPGALQVYAVAPVIDGKEGDMAAVLAGRTGAAPPAGYNFTVIGENKEGDCAVGSVGVTMDANGVITMRGGGHDIWDDGDDFVFLHQKVSGNARVTVTMLTSPTATSTWSKSGPMIRENLTRGSRNAILEVTGAEGVQAQFRAEADAASETAGDRAMEWPALAAALAKGPIHLRLTRNGDTITPEYSLDGTSFQSAGDAITISGLANEVEVGVGHTSHDASRISEVRFRDIKIEKL